jgi:alkylation response protein AidB-like acyl-CoA dehydrogenase
MAETVAEITQTVDEIAALWRAQRAERQARRHLDRADFDLLREAGILRLIAPVEAGGLWQGADLSFRHLCGVYRRLGAADPSVALVSSMHPAVVVFWLASPDPTQPAWEEQRRAVFESAAAGEQWGTVTSEPGSGGDIARTRAVAAPAPSQTPAAAGAGAAAGDPFLVGPTYAVTGDKHFGSGFGVTDRMITTAIPEGESDPTIFVLDVTDRPWDGSAGLRLIAEWDGMGMASTQSHAMRLEEAPAVRLAFDGGLDPIARAAGPYISSLFTAVVLGVLDEAIAVAREQVSRKADQLRAYERVEWARAEQDHWLACQAHDGALRSVEAGLPTAAHDALRAKEAVADLAEQTLLRLTRTLGGGTFSRRSPFAHWFEDVRALGFLRPPWGLAQDALFALSLDN